ncbi:MAG TPA: GFA family protein [Candidatus Binataceae bacterium]|nr:GFA family protein [Candidatus Binataceae bacterium]
MSTAARKYIGGCHCGQVRFEATGIIEDVSECNCSICTKKGYLHWIIPREAFRLLTDANKVATYRFNTGVAQHHFCPTCGVASFYIPRSDPDKVDVNVRCLEGVDLSRFTLRKFDGRNWEAALEARNRAGRAKE